jgi:polynucleotide kinase-phosphatase
MKLVVPELSLVVLVGASGCGKSTFARRHFRATEVLSSDFFRGLVADDENAQHATDDAFDALQYVARKRLRAGRLTVIDATNVQKEARRPYVALAREYHCVPVAIVFDLPEDLCRARNRERPERNLPGRVLGLQVRQLRAALRALSREGFRYVHVLSSPEEVEAVAIERQPTWTDRRAERGPFDIVGDVHGCLDELRALLESLGYRLEPGPGGWSARPPEGRRAIFLGDLVDRGPDTPGVLRLVMAMVRDGAALCVPGNHDVKLARRLGGADVKPTHGMDRSLEQLEREPADFREEARRFLDGLVSHYVLDGGHLVVAHAGLPAEMHGRASGRVREFSLYGDTTGESDEFGLPVRREWAASYRGGALVVYGHTPVPEPLWLNRTVNIDTGCVFGGRLTALRWPEQELVSVPAIREWATPIRSLAPAAALTAQQLHDDLLDLEDVLGKRRVETALQGAVTVRAENAAAALEVLGRFAANPKWLVYLPPTMAPPATSARPGLLEHPEEVFAAYRSERLPAVVCEQKHMGSRAVVLVCRDEDAARRRFGVSGEGRGAVLTRTGRRFFE